MTLPTYSLLKKHDETITYRVPHPDPDSPAWVRIGLFPWKLRDEQPVTHTADPDTPLDTIVEEHDGIGINIQFHAPTRHHPRPSGFRDTVSNTYDTFSRGYGDNGASFRLQNTNASELRQLGRWTALYGFCFWWWVESHTDYPFGKHGTKAEMEVPEPDTVLEDGTVIAPDGESYDAPYTLGDIELLTEDEWETPYERVRSAIEDVVAEHDTIPKIVRRQALRDVTKNYELGPVEKTKAKQNREELERVLRDCDGIGRQLRWNIIHTFNTVDELVTDIENGGDRVTEIRGVGEKRLQTLSDELETQAQ